MSEADQTSPRRWTRRPSFSPNQLLTAQQLTTLVDGQRAQSEMLMRALHGRGVIFGYAVTPGRREVDARDCEQGWTDVGSTALEISCGMALDRHGRLLHWPGGTLCYDELVNQKDCGEVYTLRAHYAEQRVGKGGCGPCADQPDWIEDGIVFSLEEGCHPADRRCPTHEYCTSWDEYICARTASGGGELPIPDDLESACEGPGKLCPVECSDLSYDAGAGIPIACVRIGNLAEKDCPERWGFRALGGACAVRPHVYRTPLLYELVHGCQNDLARVESLSWEDWCIGFGTAEFDDRVPWKEFARKFREPGELVLTFTRPIRTSTVHRGSIFFTATRWEKEADYVVTRRIPANPEPLEAGDYAREFRITINPQWVRNEIRTPSYLRAGGRIELTVRGQMLRDRCGNMLNAVPIGYDPESPGLSQPGGDFMAVFRFAKAPEKPQPPADSYED